MYKRLALGAPILLAAHGALAQSSVSIGGYLDIGIYRDLNRVWNVGPIQRSNIAFSGREDLGGGLSATFKLSHRFDPDTGANEGVGKPFFHGESTVGLAGWFGSVRMGRALDAMSDQDWQFDPWGNFNRVVSPAWDMWHYNYPTDPTGNSGLPEYGRINNGVFYDSPSFGGFTVHLNTAAREGRGTDQPYGVSLNYNEGPIAAMVAHERNSNGDTDLFLALKGSVGDLTLMGAHDRSKAGMSTAKAITLGATYAIGATTLRAGWGQLEVDGEKRQRTVGAGAAYALSKRTTVYADVASKRFPTQTRVVYGAGIAHSF